MGNLVCESCGHQNNADAAFCAACEHYLWGDRAADSTPQRHGRHRSDATPTSDVPPEPRPAPKPAPRPATTVTAPLPRVAPAPQAPAEPACPRCGTGNTTERRFCRKCGQSLMANAAVSSRSTRPPSRPPRRPGRRPWRRTGASRAARLAYRRSLPLRYRLARAGSVLAVVGVLGALLVAAGTDPVGVAQARWHDLKGTLVPVTGVVAAPDPAESVLEGYRAEWVVDGHHNQGWASRWEGGPPATGCGEARQGTGALLLTMPAAVEVRAVNVLAGLPAGDPRRPLQWRPRLLELRFADGGCQLVALPDSGAVQTHKLDDRVTTMKVRVAILDAYPPKSGEGKEVAISELTLLRRPA